MARVKNQPATVHQLKVTLSGIRPPIWRRIQVPSDVTLARLHSIIQVTMGWIDCHLHQFDVGGLVYGDVSLNDDGWFEVLNERTARLARVAPLPKSRLRYQYDFGDDWNHVILVEAVLPAASGIRYPICLKGKRACPPEDCGGTWGYGNLLEAIADPAHAEHSTLRDWLGKSFDPGAFDLNAINQRLARFH
jgi:hypothetical protein